MKLNFTPEFKNKLNEQVEFIAKDKPRAARKFKSDLLELIKKIPQRPYQYRPSIFFDRKDVRDLILKGYVVVFKVNEKADQIEVFGFIKWQEKL